MCRVPTPWCYNYECTGHREFRAIISVKSVDTAPHLLFHQLTWTRDVPQPTVSCSIEKQDSVADFPLSKQLPANIWVSFPVGQIKMYCMLLCTALFCVFASGVTGTFARMRFHNGTLNTPSLIMSVSQTESTFHYDSSNAFGTPLDESCSRTMSYGRLVCSCYIANAVVHSQSKMCSTNPTV